MTYPLQDISPRREALLRKEEQSTCVAYPPILEALTRTDETIVFIADSTGTPQLRFDTDKDCFIRVLPMNADLERLSKHPDWEIREAVALNTRADKKLLRRLARDSQVEVSDAAKSNPNYVCMSRQPAA